MHTPVLLNEVLAYLNPKPGDFIIDGTMDGGGHARAILEKLGTSGTFLGLDLDERMVASKHSWISDFSGVAIKFMRGNYAELPEILKQEKLPKADGLLLDLGFSSEQLESSGRGFSFLKDEPLLMTYNDAQIPVREILKKISEQELATILFEFGGERMSRRIAKAILERGRKKKIEYSSELAEIVRQAVPKNYERGRIHPATRTFQALRIYANKELDNLTSILGNLKSVLNPGGRVVAISFHSLEDRIVKQVFQTMKKNGEAELLTKKPVIASSEEIANNFRARSAKLRAASIRL